MLLTIVRMSLFVPLMKPSPLPYIIYSKIRRGWSKNIRRFLQGLCISRYDLISQLGSQFTFRLIGMSLYLKCIRCFIFLRRKDQIIFLNIDIEKMMHDSRNSLQKTIDMLQQYLRPIQKKLAYVEDHFELEFQA